MSRIHQVSRPLKNSRAIGYESENQVVKFLVFGGYSVVAVNWYFGHKEIDIIFEDSKFRIFVEVKSQTRNFKNHFSKSKNDLKIETICRRWALPSPENKVNQQKKEFMIQCAKAYNLKFPTHKQTRFDIISVLRFDFGTQIMHFKNAFNHLTGQNTAFGFHKKGYKSKIKSKRKDVFYI
jgi:putative endonuclease